MAGAPTSWGNCTMVSSRNSPRVAAGLLCRPQRPVFISCHSRVYSLSVSGELMA